MTEKLKPCPFCGKPGRINEIGGAVVGQRAYSVTCTSEAYEHCLAYLTYTSFARKTEAAAAWNTRATGWRPIEESRHAGYTTREAVEKALEDNDLEFLRAWWHADLDDITPPDSEAPHD